MVLSCIVGAYFHFGADKAVVSIWQNRTAIETEEQLEFIILFLHTYEA
jgi:hypothetical protein